MIEALLLIGGDLLVKNMRRKQCLLTKGFGFHETGKSKSAPQNSANWEAYF